MNTEEIKSGIERMSEFVIHSSGSDAAVIFGPKPDLNLQFYEVADSDWKTMVSHLQKALDEHVIILLNLSNLSVADHMVVCRRLNEYRNEILTISKKMKLLIVYANTVEKFRLLHSCSDFSSVARFFIHDSELHIAP